MSGLCQGLNQHKQQYPSLSLSSLDYNCVHLTLTLTLPLPLSPPHSPLSCTHKDGKTNLKCRRCGESAFYFHGLINKQKSKEFACFRQNLVMLHQAINKSFCKILKYYLSGRDLNIYQI